MKETIGFIGLGNMGGPMAANLLEAGYPLVVHDLRRDAGTALCAAGARWADDLPGLAGRAEVVITALPGPAEIERVAFGADGLVAALGPEALWIDASTNAPASARRLAEAAAGRFLDAPVTGGVRGAEAGGLTFMVGGEAAAVARARPLLAVLGCRVVHCGPAGAGAATKLLLNLLGITHTALAAEALVLGRAAGLTPEVMAAALAGCWGENAMLADIVETARGPRHWGFGRALAEKDLRLAAEMATAHGLSSRYAALALALLEACGGGSPAEDDLWRLVEAYERRAGVTIA